MISSKRPKTTDYFSKVFRPRENHFAKLLAAAVRNGIEGFHHKYLSDAQMKELNPLIRNALYTALVNINEDNDECEYIKFIEQYIPPYWEDCELSGYDFIEVKTKLDRDSKEKYHSREISDDGMFDGTDRSFNVGDIVMLREWLPKDIKAIKNYRDLTFIIVTDEQEFVRTISEFDENAETITCSALNPNYPTFKIHINDIRELYLIVKLISKNPFK